MVNYAEPMGIAERLKQRLQALDLPQQALVMPGASKSAVHAWCSGKTSNLKMENLFQAAKVLRCRPMWLALGAGPMDADREPTAEEWTLLVCYRNAPETVQSAVLRMLSAYMQARD